MEDETIQERGRGVSAQLHQEMPDEYVARIREETEGGMLVVSNERGEELGHTETIHWGTGEGLAPHTVPLQGPTRLFLTRAGHLRWARLLDATGRDVGWRGHLGDLFLTTGSDYTFLAVTLYPPR
jgi:hypothetical protein